MKIVTWNVNGARATSADIMDMLNKHKPEILMLQEIRCSAEQLRVALGSCMNEYTAFTTESEVAGYSGVSTLVRKDVLHNEEGTLMVKTLNAKVDPQLNGVKEGRAAYSVIGKTLLINTYSVNIRRNLSRVDLRLEYDKYLLAIANQFIDNLKIENIIFMGDFNVVHESIDWHAGFINNNQNAMTDMERTSFRRFMGSLGLVDAYRHLYPTGKEYTFFPYMGTARRDLKGWRIDYALVSKHLMDKVNDCYINYDYFTSDHVPLFLDIDI